MDAAPSITVIIAVIKKTKVRFTVIVRSSSSVSGPRTRRRGGRNRLNTPPEFSRTMPPDCGEFMKFAGQAALPAAL
jgi:hypothetical protein